LPNRAELRLKSTDTVIGYTLSLVRNDDGETVGAALFFKDLTHVEQIEERERLRDRLAAVGEMAAVMAHEIKNPLAGIEVLAGLLRRKVPDNADAQALVKDIISEAKMANAIVQEVLAFVRPVRLQVDRTSLQDAINAAVVMADSKATRGSIQIDAMLPRDLPPLGADQHQLTPGVLQSSDQRLRSTRGPRPDRHRRARRADGGGRRAAPRRASGGRDRCRRCVG
jgi:nitrogen-specific signal transduction histidine kinase